MSVLRPAVTCDIAYAVIVLLYTVNKKRDTTYYDKEYI